MELNKHKHHDYIVAWAKGSGIQRRVKQYEVNPVRDEPQFIWLDDSSPTWREDEVYRFKPVYKTQEVNITLLYGNFYIEPVNDGNGNYIITYNAIDESIIDISGLKNERKD